MLIGESALIHSRYFPKLADFVPSLWYARRGRVISAVAQLHQQNHQRQTGGDNVSKDDGPGLYQDAVNQPKRHAHREQAVHAQRNAAYITGAEGLPGLRHKAGGGQDGCHRANPVDEVHGVRVSCWGTGLASKHSRTK